MKRFLVLVAILVPLITAACGQPPLVVEAAITDGSTGERLALGELPIRLLPYDRDAIFDSLEQAYPVPEPQIPAELVAARQQVQEAQSAWRTAEDRWSTVRDSLRILQEQLRGLESQGLRGTPNYAQGFARFTALEQLERQVNQEQQQAFALFDQLQQATLTTTDSIRVQRDMWAEEAFADFNTVILEKLRASGGEEFVDTTDAQGMAVFTLPTGNWWIFGRYALPYEELYWNVPVEVTGDSAAVQLNRENAEIRPIL